MITKAVLAKLSPTMEEGTIVNWGKQEGDTVKVGDVLAEIEPDKANMEMEALGAGLPRKVLVPAGGKAPVRALIQQEAISAIRKAIKYPLLHAEAFQQFKFTQPKGFLLYGPPGCGKSLIGQEAAASLSKLVSESMPDRAKGDKQVPITGGAFLHIKGPESLNMWLGESERMVRDLFAKARARRREGALPFIFIDEAESILGTRRAMRSFNISNTPCADVLFGDGRDRIVAGTW